MKRSVEDVVDFYINEMRFTNLVDEFHLKFLIFVRFRICYLLNSSTAPLIAVFRYVFHWIHQQHLCSRFSNMFFIEFINNNVVRAKWYVFYWIHQQQHRCSRKMICFLLNPLSITSLFAQIFFFFFIESIINNIVVRAIWYVFYWIHHQTTSLFAQYDMFFIESIIKQHRCSRKMICFLLNPSSNNIVVRGT